jgi:hypothetical protein
MFRTPALTPTRIGLACAVAFIADAVQVMLGPLGWTFIDEILDVGTMLMVSLLIGFHPLLLPTFVVEFVPVVDMLPTWTACVIAVTVLRKRQQHVRPPTPSPQESSPVIDI